MLNPSLTSQSRRLSQGGLIDRSRPLLFRFNGEPYQGYAGDTLASALLANDVLLVARSSRLHRPRGIVCAGADEPNAVVELVGGHAPRHALATTTPLFDGLTANSLNHWPSLGFDVLAATPYLPSALSGALGNLTSLAANQPRSGGVFSDRSFAYCDVLIIGGGAKGLMAALVAGRSKARVILVDDDFRLGGRLNSDRHTVNQMPSSDWVDDIEAELRARPNVRLMLCSTLIPPSAEAPVTFSVVERLNTNVTASPAIPPTHRHWSITAKHCIMATGCIERPLVFANNDRPGIMLAGGLRTYLNRFAVAPGERVILYATHDEAADTIADITSAGAIVEAVIDPRRAPSEAVAAAADKVGAEVVTGAVTRALGGRRVEGVEVTAISGMARTFDCDLVAMSDGWYSAQPSAIGPLRAATSSATLTDCLAAGLAAGLAAAAKAGFPDALADLPETDDDGGATGADLWPHRAPLRGRAPRSHIHGLAFSDFATDSIGQSPAHQYDRGYGDSADLLTFEAAALPDTGPDLVPPPVPPYRRLTVDDVFSPTGSPQRFGRTSAPLRVSATLRRNIAIARIDARVGKNEELAARIAERIGVALPLPGQRIVAGHLAFICTRPGQWLATATADDGDDDDGDDDDDDGQQFAQQLSDDLSAFAAITDASPDLGIIDVTGANSRDLLAKGLELDTHRDAFAPGHCARAALGRMVVTVSCIDAGTAYQLAVDVGDMPDFANWLAAAGTEFGLETL